MTYGVSSLGGVEPSVKHRSVNAGLLEAERPTNAAWSFNALREKLTAIQEAAIRTGPEGRR